jgi:pimeloyl-ACP methyl ester carboxylesterase
VLLLDTRPDADGHEARAGREKSIATLEAGGKAEVIEGLLTRLVAPAASESVKQQLRMIMMRHSPEAMIAAQRAMLARRDQRDVLRALNVPALVVVGEEDVISPPAVAEEMRDLSAGTLIRVTGAGHMSIMENPAEAAAGILAWIKRVAGKA